MRVYWRARAKLEQQVRVPVAVASGSIIDICFDAYSGRKFAFLCFNRLGRLTPGNKKLNFVILRFRCRAAGLFLLLRRLISR